MLTFFKLLRKTFQREARRDSFLANASSVLSDETNLLFVYGSLMRGMERAAFMSNVDKARFVATGSVTGVLYDTGAFPGMKEDDGTSLVQGELYELLDPITFFETLDLIEGYWPEQPERSLFVRKRVVARTAAGEQTAWAYILNQALADAKPIPSGDYRQCPGESTLAELE